MPAGHSLTVTSGKVTSSLNLGFLVVQDDNIQFQKRFIMGYLVSSIMFSSCLLCAGTGEVTKDKMNVIPAFLELTVQQKRQVLNMNVGHF